MLAIRKRRLRSRLSPRGRAIVVGIGVRVLLATAIVSGTYLIVRRVHSDLKQMSRYQVDLARLKLEVPSWVTPAIRSQLKQIPDFPQTFSILERGIAEKVAVAYSQNPWVVKVRQVEKQYPRSLRISLEVRRPVAAVRFRGRYYLADALGVRLPLDFTSWPHQDLDLPFVKDATSPPPAPGEVWQDAAVEAGLAVSAILLKADSGVHKRITAIDVTNLKGVRSPTESEIVLLTENRIPIYWGRSPLTYSPRELSAAQKLSNLSIAYQRTNGLRQHNIQYIDVRFPDVYICRRPTGQTPASSAVARQPS